MKMNTLSYGLMGLLTSESYTGYDLMLKMRLFWNVNHSNIYPVLSALEKECLVEYELIKQTGKPDKKIYSITDNGIKLVNKWLKGDVNEPKPKDEMYLKFYCINLLDSDDAIKFIEKRENIYLRKVEYYNKELNEVIKVHADAEKNTKSPYFGKYILLLKDIRAANEDIRWCKQLCKIYRK